MANKWVYMFSEGDMTMRNLLGGKGANLAEMTSIGLPVPQGFTITTEACTQYYEDGRKINDEIMAQAMEGVKKMEAVSYTHLWDYGNLGVELKNNVKRAWWQKFIQENPYNVGVDCALLMNPQTWVASGHLGGFSDPLMDCKECHERFRADKILSLIHI